MLCASLHPFRGVMGVELNPGLAVIARENAALFAEHDAASLAPVEVVQGDVLEVEWPQEPWWRICFIRLRSRGAAVSGAGGSGVCGASGRF